MKAKVQYNDFTGSVAADISDMIAANKGNYISSIGEYFNVDQERFKVLGVSLSGIYDFEVTLICLDKHRSTPMNDFMVKMKLDLDVEGQKRMLDLLFKRLNFVLYDSGQEDYQQLETSEVICYKDFHDLNYDE